MTDEHFLEMSIQEEKLPHGLVLKRHALLKFNPHRYTSHLWLVFIFVLKALRSLVKYDILEHCSRQDFFKFFFNDLLNPIHFHVSCANLLWRLETCNTVVCILFTAHCFSCFVNPLIDRYNWRCWNCSYHSSEI